MNIRTLEQRLQAQKTRVGLVGGMLCVRVANDVQEPLSAGIDPADWHVELVLKESYDPASDEHTAKYLAHRNIPDGIEKMCSDVVAHECGHWELPRGSGNGCPYDVPHHDQITESIADELRASGKEGMAKYVANAFEDILVNVNARQITSHSGQVLFWDAQGRTHGQFNKFYEAFVRTNIRLWGDAVDSKFLRRWYKHEDATNNAIKELLAAWRLPLERGPDGVRARVAQLYRKEGWNALASQFATIMAPLLDETQEHQMFGAGTNAPDSSQSEDQPQDGGAQGSAFDKKLGTREGKEDAAGARYEAGNGQSQLRESYEQLDALYRCLARSIPVEVETFTRSHSFPLAPYGREEYNPERHDLLSRKINLGIQADGSVGVIVNKGSIMADAPYKKSVRKFPKFRLAVLDTSESMSWAPDGNRTSIGSTAFIPWGDNSRYHYALLGYYGIEAFLQRQHIAPYVDAGVVNFSSQTLGATGEDARKLLLTPQFGSTVLDVEALRAHTGDGSFLLSLSDGDIQNWGSIKNEYHALLQGNIAAHIQIGAHTAFSRDLKKWGVPVYQVSSGEDLSRLMVKVASTAYKSYGRQAL